MVVTSDLPAEASKGRPKNGNLNGLKNLVESRIQEYRSNIQSLWYNLEHASEKCEKVVPRCFWRTLKLSWKF